MEIFAEEILLPSLASLKVGFLCDLLLAATYEAWDLEGYLVPKGNPLMSKKCLVGTYHRGKVHLVVSEDS